MKRTALVLLLVVVALLVLLVVCVGSGLGLREEVTAWALLMTLVGVSLYALETQRLRLETQSMALHTERLACATQELATETQKGAEETRKLTAETERMRRDAAQAQAFSALTEVHRVLNEPRTRVLRDYLCDQFSPVFEMGIRKYVGVDYAGEEEVRLEAIRRDSDTLGSKLPDLMDYLKMANLGTDAEGTEITLQVAERTLASIDVLTLPVCEGIKSALIAAHAYRSVLEKTARHLVPYVAVQRALRPEPGYKEHYVRLLHELHIDHSPLAPVGWEDDLQAHASGSLPDR